MAEPRTARTVREISGQLPHARVRNAPQLFQSTGDLCRDASELDARTARRRRVEQSRNRSAVSGAGQWCGGDVEPPSALADAGDRTRVGAVCGRRERLFRADSSVDRRVGTKWATQG